MALTLTPLPGIPLVAPGDDLVDIILQGLERAGKRLQNGDVIVVEIEGIGCLENRCRVMA